jgi:hypothetical protein
VASTPGADSHKKDVPSFEIVMLSKTVPGVIPVVGVKFAAAVAGVDTVTNPAATANADAKSARGRFIMLFSLLVMKVVNNIIRVRIRLFTSTHPRSSAF